MRRRRPWWQRFVRFTARSVPTPYRVALQVRELEPRLVPTLLGNQLFPADNPWNQLITNAPVAANSNTLVQSIGLTKSVHADFGAAIWAGSLIGIPFNAVPGTQPKVNIVIDAYPGESDLQPIPIPAGAVIEGDPLPSAQNTSDRHMIIYDQDNNIVYETFNTHRPSEEPDQQWHADSEAVWNLNTDTFRPAGWTSADAAGLPILPGLVRPDEVYDQGKITHALRFTVPHTDNAYVFPASHLAGSNNPAYPRMGERFRLKASVDISGFSPANQVILQALKDYGMIVADNGSGWYLSGEPSSRWNDSDLAQLGRLNGSAFEAVDLTPAVTGLSQASGATAGGSQVVISGVNFGGGAGRTQVFFGNTPATFWTITSANTIAATAPPEASGTVTVTVVTPYGTSASSPAAQFTYLNQVGPPPPLGSETFVIGLDNQVYGEKFDRSGNSLNGYFLTAPGQVKALAVGQDAAGDSVAFVIGLDNQLYVQRFDSNGNSLGGYQQAAPGQIKSVCVGRDAASDPEVFAIGLDNQVWAEKFGATGNPAGGYFLTNPGQVKSMAVGHAAGGAPEVFVIGLDSQVWAEKLDATGNPAGGYFLTNPGQVQSLHVASGGGQPEVFVTGLDNEVWAEKFDAAGNPLGGYFLTAAGQVKSLSVGQDAAGNPEVFVIGLDDQVWTATFDAGGNPLSGYGLTAAGRVKAMALAHDAAGNPEVFAIGLDNQVWADKLGLAGTVLSPYGLAAGGQVLFIAS